MKLNKKLSVILSFIAIITITTFILLYYNITPKSDEKSAINLYESLIDLTLKEKNFLISGKYISLDLKNLIDPLNKENLSENSKKEIIDYCQKYNEVIYTKNKDELLTLDYSDGENLHGSYIKIKIDSIYKARTTVSVYYYVSNLSSGNIIYEAVYSKGKWNIEKTANIVQSKL